MTTLWFRAETRRDPEVVQWITARHPSPRASGGRVRPGDPRAGQLLAGRYRLRQPVAHGAAGAVWRAYDELLAREVAAKQLADRRSRGLVEARIAARVRHPSVATVHDAIRHEDSDWLVLDYHRGGTLADLLDRRRRLPPPIVAALGLQLVAALTAVHAVGVVHCRDALVLAAGERAASQALRHARTKAHRGWPRQLAAPRHLAGYASLLAVIGYQWRARQRSAA